MKPVPFRLFLILCFLVPGFVRSQAGSGPETAPPNSTPETAPPLEGKIPKIEFLKMEHDFGKVPEGPPVTTTFRFRNTGTAVLKIGEVRASCGCTAAAAEGSTEIPPGGTGAIKATYDTQNRPGKVTKTITVASNDPARPSVTLRLTAEVVRDVDIQPPQAYFFGVRKGETRSVTVTVLGKEGLRLKPGEPSVRNGLVTVEKEPFAEGGRRGARLIVTLKGAADYGPLEDEITLPTGYAKKPEVQIPVRGEVVGRVQVFPRSIHFGNDLSRSVTLSVNANPPLGFTVRRVGTEKGIARPWVIREPQPDGTTRYQVVVGVKKSLPAGPYTDEVILYTNDDEQPEVRVPVQGTAPGG